MQKSPIKERYSAKETYHFKEPTNRSHLIVECPIRFVKLSERNVLRLWTCVLATRKTTNFKETPFSTRKKPVWARRDGAQSACERNAAIDYLPALGHHFCSVLGPDFAVARKFSSLPSVCKSAETPEKTLIFQKSGGSTQQFSNV